MVLCLDEELSMQFLLLGRCKNVLWKKKDLYFAFVDLEKAFDRVPLT